MTLTRFWVVLRRFTCSNFRRKHKNLVDPKQTVHMYVCSLTDWQSSCIVATSLSTSIHWMENSKCFIEQYQRVAAAIIIHEEQR